MFLIPALSAFTADTVVVYLYTNFQYLLGDYGKMILINIILQW